MIELFDSNALRNVMSHRMVNKLHFHVQSTYSSIKGANCASEKCVGKLNEVPIRMGKLIAPIYLLAPEETS